MQSGTLTTNDWRWTMGCLRATASVGSTTNRFFYDGWAMIRETDGTTTNDYVYAYGLDLSGSMQGAGTIGGLLAAALNGTNVFYSYDANGNVTELVNTDASTAARYQYDPFGNTILADDADSSGAISENPFRFSTKYTDDETGLLYYGYRYYSPDLGRWLSRDPIGEEGGTHLYALTLNAPIDAVDFLGLAWNITRSSDYNWAVAYPDSASDTFNTLANTIRLQFDERTKWLKKAGGAFVDEGDAAAVNCRYGVPNTMIVYTSKKAKISDVLPIPSLVQAFRDVAEENGDVFEARGYKVERRLFASSQDLFKELWKTDGIVAYAFAGHGADNGTLLIEGNIWYGFVAHPGSDLAVAPEDVSPPYKLQGVAGYSCGSASPITGYSGLTFWKSHRSNNGGTFIGYVGGVKWANIGEREFKINPGLASSRSGRIPLLLVP